MLRAWSMRGLLYVGVARGTDIRQLHLLDRFPFDYQLVRVYFFIDWLPGTATRQTKPSSWTPCLRADQSST